MDPRGQQKRRGHGRIIAAGSGRVPRVKRDIAFGGQACDCLERIDPDGAPVDDCEHCDNAPVFWVVPRGASLSQACCDPDAEDVDDDDLILIHRGGCTWSSGLFDCGDYLDRQWVLTIGEEYVTFRLEKGDGRHTTYYLPRDEWHCLGPNLLSLRGDSRPDCGGCPFCIEPRIVFPAQCQCFGASGESKYIHFSGCGELSGSHLLKAPSFGTVVDCPTSGFNDWPGGCWNLETPVPIETVLGSRTIDIRLGIRCNLTEPAQWEGLIHVTIEGGAAGCRPAQPGCDSRIAWGMAWNHDPDHPPLLNCDPFFFAPPDNAVFAAGLCDCDELLDCVGGSFTITN